MHGGILVRMAVGLCMLVTVNVVAPLEGVVEAIDMDLKLCDHSVTDKCVSVARRACVILITYEQHRCTWLRFCFLAINSCVLAGLHM